MNVSEFVDRFAAELERDMQKQRLAVAAGSAKDFPAYKYACGTIEGMRRALDIATSVMKATSR